MTKEQKIKWLKDATNDQVIDQFRWTVIKLSNGTIAEKVEANEDYELVVSELKWRMGGC